MNPGKRRDFFMTMEHTTIAIQGFEGSFHHVAATKYFGRKAHVLPCISFQDVINTTQSGACTFGLMAIENSIAGSILPNYNQLHRSKLFIAGEIYLQINQNLIANKGVTLNDLKEVHSHHMALQQCLQYLELYKWKLVESEDTALSAKLIHQHRSKHIAAIGSTLAAELYGLDILAPSIQTMKNNYTRFLVLQKQQTTTADATKASLCFQTDHSKGSLAKVLNMIADADINLSKLQSFPIPGSQFSYRFHADMEFDDIRQFEKALTDMSAHTESIRVYGIYENGKKKLRLKNQTSA